jgi:hypothetical protein
VADFETKLRWLSERGNPVGAEELIERIEADLAGDPLVVLAERREGTLMTKTQQPPTTRPPGRFRGPAWAVAVFVVVLAVAGIYLATSGDDYQVAESTPNTETMTDLEIIEAGVGALYSGDADRAVELFELHGLFADSAAANDEWIRDEVAYQGAIEGRVTVDCYERATPGVFNCSWLYHNAFTDAIGYVDSPMDPIWVVVEGGVITEFGRFPFQESEEGVPIMGDLRAFLREVGESPENANSLCGFGYPYTRSGRFTLECVDFMMDHLDEWAAWAESN